MSVDGPSGQSADSLRTRLQQTTTTHARSTKTQNGVHFPTFHTLWSYENTLPLCSRMTLRKQITDPLKDPLNRRRDLLSILFQRTQNSPKSSQTFVSICPHFYFFLGMTGLKELSAEKWTCSLTAPECDRDADRVERAAVSRPERCRCADWLPVRTGAKEGKTPE